MPSVFDASVGRGAWRERTGSAKAAGGFAPPIVHRALRSAGQPLRHGLRRTMEAGFGHDFSRVRVHSGAEAAESARSVGARAYTVGSDIVLSAGAAVEGAAGRRLLAHELAHVVQQRGVRPTATIRVGPPDDRYEMQARRVVAAGDGWQSAALAPIAEGGGAPACALQREMKFEFQSRNKIFRNDGRTARPLQRKYGPEDYLVKGTSGVRLESETHGVLEFETGWSKKWSKLREQISEAYRMTQEMNAAGDVSPRRKSFPFDVAELRTGTRQELTRGRWASRKGMEGGSEEILGKRETLETEISDPSWNSGIQSSEGILLGQYESLLTQHEWSDYRTPVIASADNILTKARPAGKKVPNLDNLRNFLQLVLNYIKRGAGGEASRRAGSFADVRGMPAKQAFTLMSRTDLSSIYDSLLSRAEQVVFNKIVRDGLILKEMGLTRRTPFFVEGFGTHGHHRGPTVHQWLAGIPKGKDLLSVQTDPSLSAAMGAHDVELTPGRKDTELVKFEVRNTVRGAWKTARDWEAYAHDVFMLAASRRKRPTGKGETGLEP